MIVYKVVHEEPGGKLVSCGTVGKHKQQYKPGEAKICPSMFVFVELYQAKKYRSTHRKETIFECEAPRISPAPPKVLGYGLVDSYFEDFWRNTSEVPSTVLQPPTAGAFTCDELTLLRKIEP